MDKYGVDQAAPDSTKEAAESRPKVCPWCSLEVIEHGPVILCPTHGSAPFELKNE